MTELRRLGFGDDAVHLRTAAGPAWVVDSIERIPPFLRRIAFAGRSRDFRYYEVQEATLHGQFDHRYLVLHHEAAGEWAIQPLFFVHQDLLAGLPQGLRALFAGIRQYWPGFLKLPMLMIGCATGEADLDHDQPWLPRALHDAIESYRRRSKALIILLKDFPASYRSALAPFSRNGFHRAPSLPAARLDLDFATFEEYMTARLGKVFRKNLRRKLRASERAAPITMEVVADASSIAAEIYPLYLQTYHRSQFTFEKLTEDYFRQIGQCLPDRTRFFLWRQNGRLIAFNLCLVHEATGTLHDLNLGMDYTVALDLSLYFVTWRDMIEWALRQGLRSYHTGPLNYDPKAHLKLRLVPLDLYVRYNWSPLNPLFKLALRYLEPTHHDPILQRFPNADEL